MHSSLNLCFPPGFRSTVSPARDRVSSSAAGGVWRSAPNLSRSWRNSWHCSGAKALLSAYLTIICPSVGPLHSNQVLLIAPSLENSVINLLKEV